jgi:hypothetical protein
MGENEVTQDLVRERAEVADQLANARLKFTEPSDLERWLKCRKASSAIQVRIRDTR